jgi:alpha-1,3-glucosyltransferase
MTQWFWVVFWLSIAIRLSLGFWPYSGEGKPPSFGDFEAQRHWKELTFNLPVKEWYTFDRSYWPLDYPPLTAYHEFILGHLSNVLVGPDSVALGSSRGFESPEMKMFMRYSVLFTDLLVYYSAVFYLFFYLFFLFVFLD